MSSPPPTGPRRIRSPPTLAGPVKGWSKAHMSGPPLPREFQQLLRHCEALCDKHYCPRHTHHARRDRLPSRLTAVPLGSPVKCADVTESLGNHELEAEVRAAAFVTRGGMLQKWPMSLRFRCAARAASPRRRRPLAASCRLVPPRAASRRPMPPTPERAPRIDGAARAVGERHQRHRHPRPDAAPAR